MSAKKIPRRHAIPILYTRGTHYDVGFDTGRTFAAIIRNFLQLYEPLNSSYLPLYETEEGKRVYKETLESVRKSFPQYVRELEGVADGAQVEFHKLFLIHMDEILPISLERENTVNGKQPVGCSSIMVNKTQCQILAHTEDALSETLNHFYFVDAHIISDCPQGKYKVKEEHFLSLCYAGSLPGYTMSYNHHGLAFTINTISASELRSGKTPRVFLTRALLAAENWDQAKTILTDAGVGAADACTVNMVFLKKDEKPSFYNVEIGPALGEDTESQVNIKEVPEGEQNYHCNRYQRLKLPENNELMIASSDSRTKTFNSFKLPKTKEEVLEMLGDTSMEPHPVFRDSEDLDEIVKTIAVGIFDFEKKTYSIYADNPKNNEPLVVLPLHLKE